MGTTRWAVLLRGINVGGHRKVPMGKLRTLAGELGFQNVATYAASGNLVADKDASREDVIEAFEQGLAETFGFEVEVVVKTAAEIDHAANIDVFSDAVAERPQLVHAVFARVAAPDDIAEQLSEHLADDESIAVADGQLFIDYAGGSARSKVSHDVLRRAFGGIVTSRNMRTVNKLQSMVADGPS